MPIPALQRMGILISAKLLRLFAAYAWTAAPSQFTIHGT